ncbi:MAG TPA: RIP metalloprotease RseP [Xanthobacteraceae bacterium]|jgi:regulator of sigma E protease|nr:RIP metalloprotease RseP [Xanthobacteraceae bacterium]
MSSLGALGGNFTGWVIPVLFTLTIIVFFHEFGHFLVARWCGIKVLVFSIGFGPELVGFYDRRGTRWKVSAIPLGGYVKFFGDENEASVPDAATLAAMTEEERKQSFPGQAVGARAAVVAAGPVTNFILAIILFAGVFLAYGKTTAIPRIAGVEPNSPAAAAGFKVGDVIVSIDGAKIDNFADVQRIVSFSPGVTLTIVVDRGGVPYTLKATPVEKDKRGMLGITRSNEPGDVRTEAVAPLEALRLGADRTWLVVTSTMTYLRDVVVGRQSADQIGGPIKIAQISVEAAKLGFGPLLELTALLSVSIGLLNLFPIPLLDGGHLLFYAIEWVRGRPLSERAQEVSFRIGLAIVLMLMIFATFNDLRPLIMGS